MAVDRAVALAVARVLPVVRAVARLRVVAWAVARAMAVAVMLVVAVALTMVAVVMAADVAAVMGCRGSGVSVGGVESADATSPVAASWKASLVPRGEWFPPPS